MGNKVAKFHLVVAMRVWTTLSSSRIDYLLQEMYTFVGNRGASQLQKNGLSAEN
jgi:hypothetical protein